MAAPRISIWLARLVAREGLQRLVDAFKVLGVLEGLQLIREKLGNYLEGALLVVKIGLVRNDLLGGRG